ncbi:MAG: PorT family protein [Bacteroidaceae bacterium]|nr:PorT family protein [Bacteroidaceae bacterium]
MKRHFIMLVLLLTASHALALDNEPKKGFTWQVFGGFNVANVTGDFLSPAPIVAGECDPKVGVDVGFKVDYILPNAKGTYITAGVDWIQRGSKTDFNNPGAGTGGADLTGTYKIQAHYVEVPIRVGFRYNISKIWGVYGELGPYLAVGVGGNLRQNFDDDAFDSRKVNYFTKKYSQEFNATWNERGIQRFDCGIGFRVGGEYHNQYSLTFGYDWGFSDSFTHDFRKNMLALNGTPLKERKNHNMTLTFGFRF